MCIAIYKPKSIVIPFSTLNRAFQANSDGAGFAVRQHNTVTIHKGYMTFSAFKTAYRKYAAEECLIHFRFATMGTINTENCHPFALPDGSAMIHNGHFAGFGSPLISDTNEWCSTVLSPLVRKYPGIVKNWAMRELLEQAIGHSKVVILPTSGKAIILNEHKGFWKDGAWFSAKVPSKAELLYETRYYSSLFKGKNTPSKHEAPLAREDDPTLCSVCQETLQGYDTMGYYRMCDYCGSERDISYIQKESYVTHDDIDRLPDNDSDTSIPF